MTSHDSRVDDYLAALPEWQRTTLKRVRDVLHRTDPEMTETIKRTVQPYFVLDGNVAAFLAAKDHVNVFLYDPLVDDPAGIITAGHDNQTGRQIAIRDGERIDAPAFVAMIGQIVEHNRAGGWRTLR